MNASTRIYAGGAIAYGGQPAINDLLAAQYNTVIVWSVHVHSNGSLYLNNDQLVTGGVYKEGAPLNLPSRLAQLSKAGVEIIFSVGSGGVDDYTNIGNLLNGKPAQPGNPLYDNFEALRNAMVSAGGTIDAIDFDNEDNFDSSVMANFGITLANIGYPHVTFCPYDNESVWYDTMSKLVAAKGTNFVNAIHLQCYSGGSWNQGQVGDWVSGFKTAGGNALMIPGLATDQAAAGPWWYQNAPGANVKTVPNVAMFEGANWDNYLYTQNFASVDNALQAAQTAASFFFYCRNPIVLTNGRSFQTGDAVFFMGTPWWGSAPQCDAYYLGGPCTNIYNLPVGGCPPDLEKQYSDWKGVADGGFIWMYDSVISCYLSGCCGGTMEQPAGTALAYREAISNGLS
ncbi:MAG TPA: hypothetical protein VI306_17610 [Pyrinomonadaceae bacterium]